LATIWLIVLLPGFIWPASRKKLWIGTDKRSLRM
jgi:hypothetical protein